MMFDREGHQKHETPPLSGVSEAFAATSCKVDGSGRVIAECKRNLHQNTDIPQG